MSKAENMVKAFKDDMDIHTKTAMDIYHVEKEQVTKTMRRNAKAVNFGILYGISGFGLGDDLGISVKEAKEFIDHYLETFPGIKNYMESVKEEARKNGYTKTLFNRKRVIDELKNTNYMIRQQGERMALNTPVQGTAADILKLAMIDIFEEFNKRNLKSKMIIQVHDELVFDVKEDELETVIKIVKEKMENVYKFDVPLKVDIEYGKDWYDAK
jgi:DNA polymerase-1